MIAADQPTIFGPRVIAALSSRADGNMKFGLGDDDQAVKNRYNFLQAAGIDPAHATLVGITYATDDFTKYRTVTADQKGNGILQPTAVEPVDALVVDQPGHALFLPLADCIGAIIYDPDHHVLMVSHLGRHSVEMDGAAKSIQHLVQFYSTNPAQLKVWLSPGVGKTSYPLHAFDGRGLREVIVDQLLAAGVLHSNIEHADVDTAASDNYYSHSQFLQGSPKSQGRFAIVACLL
jgi:copper oxidase (laccase) domain-containing protein